jgi:hypothetical protein
MKETTLNVTSAYRISSKESLLQSNLVFPKKDDWESVIMGGSLKNRRLLMGDTFRPVSCGNDVAALFWHLQVSVVRPSAAELRALLWHCGMGIP